MQDDEDAGESDSKPQWKKAWCLQCDQFREYVGIIKYYMSYSLNSSKGGYIRDYIGDYYRGY